MEGIKPEITLNGGGKSEISGFTPQGKSGIGEREKLPDIRITGKEFYSTMSQVIIYSGSILVERKDENISHFFCFWKESVIKKEKVHQRRTRKK